MPALFAYLIALGLLLGGGYGALSWLAAPEPVKVVAKAKSKPPSPPYAEANAEPMSSPASRPETVRSAAEPVQSEGNAPSIAPPVDGSAHVAATSSDQPPSPSPEARPVANEQRAAAEDAGPAQDQQIRSARAEIAPVAVEKETKSYVEAPAQDAKQRRYVKPRQDDRQAAHAATEASSGSVHAAAPAVLAKVARTAKRPQLREAIRRSEERPLTLMTLRTIEFPDGSRMTRLVPYRGGQRAMAFEEE